MITFFFLPNITTPGGVQSLIINISKALSQRNIRIKLIDTQNGIIYNELKSNNLNFDFYDYNNDKTRDCVNEDDVIISFGSFSRDYQYFRNKNIRYAYWSVFADDLIFKFNFRISISKQKYSNNNFISKFCTNRLVRLLSERKALNIMEEAHIDIYKMYNSKFNNLKYSTILIPINIGEKINRDIINENEINISYIGRNENWKILPFIHLFKDLIKLKLNKTVNIFLFSDNCDTYFEYIKNFNIKLPGNINIITYNNYTSNLIKNILVSKVDILFAMGTSLLEGASIGIPTVILDPTYTELPENYKYRWLHEENGYSLGLATWKMQNTRGDSLESIFKLIYEEKKYKQISNLTYSYAKKYHDINNVIEVFIKSINQTELRLKDLYWVYILLTVKYSIQKIVKKIFRK